MRVLVVDDEPSVAEVIAEAVRARGDSALVCLDATEALNMLETTAVDGVLTMSPRNPATIVTNSSAAAASAPAASSAATR